MICPIDALDSLAGVLIGREDGFDHQALTEFTGVTETAAQLAL